MNNNNKKKKTITLIHPNSYATGDGGLRQVNCLNRTKKNESGKSLTLPSRMDSAGYRLPTHTVPWAPVPLRISG